MAEQHEYHQGRPESAQSRERSELIGEYNRLAAEWKQLDRLWTAAKANLFQPLSADVAAKVDLLKVELSTLHSRQVEIIDRQTEIELAVIDSYIQP